MTTTTTTSTTVPLLLLLLLLVVGDMSSMKSRMAKQKLYDKSNIHAYIAHQLDVTCIRRGYVDRSSDDDGAARCIDRYHSFYKQSCYKIR